MKKISSNNSGVFLVEQCQAVSVDSYVAQAKQKLKEDFIKLCLSVDDYELELTSIKLHHGGLRYMFVAPCCSKRVFKLYRHPMTQLLACRECNQLEYRSRVYSGMIESC